MLETQPLLYRYTFEPIEPHDALPITEDFDARDPDNGLYDCITTLLRLNTPRQLEWWMDDGHYLFERIDEER